MDRFDRWMQSVDRWTYRAIGCSAYDLPDQPFRDWHDEGLSPLDAAREMLRNEGWQSDHPFFQEEA